MFFKKNANVPKEISDANVTQWYNTLSDRDKNKTLRYIGNADTSSQYRFFLSVAEAAENDENHKLASLLCEQCLSLKLTEMERFVASELLIESYIGSKRYDDAKLLCESNLSLYPSLRSQIMDMNGGTLPEKMSCRNRYVDILVGIESGYDDAFALLDRFLTMGLITKEDHAFRKQSLKIHRLQRSFDGVYTYGYKE
jgi:hypothetical protein